MGEAGGQTPSQADQKSFAERAKQTVTRRDFLIGAGAGAATAVVVLGGAAVATKAVSPSTTTTTTTAVGQGPLPATMRRVALLTAIPKPTDVQIAEGLAGNICRCGAYKKVFTSVQTAAAEMRGEKVTHLAAPVLAIVTATATAPTATGTSKEFTFATPFATIEDFDTFVEPLKKRDGIVNISGSERTITVTWDPGKLNEQQVRDLLASLGHAVR